MSIPTQRNVDPEPVGQGLTWRRLVTIAGILAAGTMGLVSLGLGDLEGGVVTVGFAAATWMTRVRRGRLGAVGLAAASAITLFFMLTAAITNIRVGSELSSTMTSAVLAAVALLGLVSAVGFLVAENSLSTSAPRMGLIASIGLLLGLIIWGNSAARPEPATGDVLLLAKNVAFSDSEIAAPAGEITVTMANDDLFWHTFTIEELGVDLRVPVGAELSVTFEAQPGRYEFVCAIPGHTEAGMRGTLIVEQ